MKNLLFTGNPATGKTFLARAAAYYLCHEQLNKEYPRTVTLAELGIKRAPQSWQYYKTRYIKGEIK